MTPAFSVPGAGCPGRPAVASTVTVSRIPTAAVATSGIVYGEPKPDAAACGADVAPISSAAQPAQRRPAWQPRAVRRLTAAAASDPAASPAAGAGCPAVVTAIPHL